MSGRYTDTDEGEWFHVPRKLQIGCCDCGLVHNVELKVINRRIWMRATRNVRATSQRRRHGIKLYKSV